MTFQLTLPGALQRPAAAIVDTTMALAGLPVRALSLVTTAEQTLSTVDAAVARVEELLERTAALVGAAQQATSAAADLVARADAVTSRADDIVTAAHRVSGDAAVTVEQASSTAAAAGSLLELYREPLHTLEPTVRRLAETTDPKEVDALVNLVDRLPSLADAMDRDVIPLLRRLDQIGPDLHRLLEVVSDLDDLVRRLPAWIRPSGADEDT